MRVLMIGGTGTISAAIVRRLAAETDWELWVLNRGNRSSELPGRITQITADIHNETDVAEKLGDVRFDAVCDFISFHLEDVERAWRLFRGRTGQYLFTSSASAYHKPPADYRVSEATALANPWWQYSRDKIACEEYLMDRYRQEGFPVTIVRPSHTYDERHIPTGLHGKRGFWQVIQRMREGKPVLVHGDGTSLWTVTFNTDFAVGYTGLLGNPRAIGEAVQITGDETLSWNQIYETIAAALGVEARLCHVSSEFLAAAGKKYGYDFAGSLLGDKSVSVVFDNTRLHRLVPEMTTSVPFHRGVRIALDYILSHPAECQIPDPEFDAWCDRVAAALDRAQQEI